MPHAHALMCIEEKPSQSCKIQPTLQPFHERIVHYLSEGYAVIYVTEDSINQAVRNLSKVDVPIEDYIESGALRIIDGDSFYSPTDTKLDYSILLSQWHKVISSVPKKNFKGLIFMGMPHRAFFDNKETLQKLIEYELQITKSNDSSFQAVCCYSKGLLDKLSLGHLIRILNAHQDIAVSQVREHNRSGDHSKKYGSNSSSRGGSGGPERSVKIIDLIEEGLAKALGKETSILVLKTLKLIYGINRDDVPAKPELFEEKIKRLFGGTAELILKIIVERIVQEIIVDP